MHVVMFGAAVALILLLSPAPKQETVVLLPGPDGKVGVVVVDRGGERTVLDKPYAITRSLGFEELEHGRLAGEEVKREFGTVLAALPPRPTSYMLYFVAGLDELTDDSKRELERVLAELRSRPQSDIVIIGHTDRVGSESWNDALSLQRAERVRAELLGLGLDPNRVTVAGRGEREPLVRTADGVEEPRNRRVEISVR